MSKEILFDAKAREKLKAGVTSSPMPSKSPSVPRAATS